MYGQEVNIGAPPPDDVTNLMNVLGIFWLHFLSSGWRRGHVGHLYFQQCPPPPDVLCQDQSSCQAAFCDEVASLSLNVFRAIECPTGERVPVLTLVLRVPLRLLTCVQTVLVSVFVASALSSRTDSSLTVQPSPRRRRLN